MAETNSYMAVCLQRLFQSLPPTLLSFPAFSSLRKLVGARVIPWELGRREELLCWWGWPELPAPAPLQQPQWGSCQEGISGMRVTDSATPITQKFSAGRVRLWMLNLLCRSSRGLGWFWFFGVFFPRFQTLLNRRKTPPALLMAFSLF